MNKHFKYAEQLVKKSISILEQIVGQDEEDISYYNPIVLDAIIKYLIEARTQIAIGQYIIQPRMKVLL